MLGACRLREGSSPEGIDWDRLLSLFSGPGGQRPAHDPVFYYQQSRRGQLPTTDHRWNRGAAHHSGAVPYARQDSARHRYTSR